MIDNAILNHMRYPWIFFTILGIWVAIAIIISKETNIDATLLYFAGLGISIALAVIGFKSAV